MVPVCGETAQKEKAVMSSGIVFSYLCPQGSSTPPHAIQR